MPFKLLWGISTNFSVLSPCYGQVAYALRTRAPVATKDSKLPFVLPLDLHVLGLPLAFILSQDQTLHCKKSFNILACFSKALNSKTLNIFERIQLLHYFKEHIVRDIVLGTSHRLSFKADCKGKDFFLTSKLFQKKFSKIFQSQSISELVCFRYFLKADAKVATFLKPANLFRKKFQHFLGCFL